MNPQIRHAQRACEAAKARQAIVVWFDEHGQYAVASYGETKAECSAVKPVCIAIADMFDSGYLERPGAEANGGERPDHRRGELGGWNEYDRLRNEREKRAADLAAAGAAVRKMEAPIASTGHLTSVFWFVRDWADAIGPNPARLRAARRSKIERDAALAEQALKT